MSFNEVNVKRDQGGKFDHKVGSPASVSLSAPVVYGGQFGVRPETIEPAEEDYAEARASLGISADAELIGDQPTHVEGRAQHLARLHEPRRAFDEGRPHYLDEKLDAIWNGEGGGYSEAMLQTHLDRTQNLRAQFESGAISAQGVVGTNVKGDGQEAALAYLDKAEGEYSEALRTHGRSFRLNVDNAYSEYHRRQG